MRQKKWRSEAEHQMAIRLFMEKLKREGIVRWTGYYSPDWHIRLDDNPPEGADQQPKPLS